MIKNKVPYQIVIKDALNFTKFGCSSTAFILYWLLATVSSEVLFSNPVIEMSIREFRNRTGFGEGKVRRGLDELEEKGWIDRIRQGVQKVNQYRVHESPVDRLDPRF